MPSRPVQRMRRRRRSRRGRAEARPVIGSRRFFGGGLWTPSDYASRAARPRTRRPRANPSTSTSRNWDVSSTPATAPPASAPIAAQRLGRPPPIDRLLPSPRHHHPVRPHRRLHLSLQTLRRARRWHAAPYLHSPQTNGKAVRFIQPLTGEHVYARPYDSSAHRAAGRDGRVNSVLLNAPVGIAKLQQKILAVHTGTLPKPVMKGRTALSA